ncbi:MAG: sulfatase-like hydrolase/transferase, partial [Phycisphaerae bacterium]|nr:sulfatase-like hydrolase/transferase [Phycisphaerae bacterium]
MDRRTFLAGIAVAAGTAATGVLTAAPKPVSKKPNILFFLADDQRNDTLGCAGHPFVKTPNIDRLAADGLRFKNAFVITSICMVSRANILTGTAGRTHCVLTRAPEVKPDALRETYPLELRKAGYRTGYVGKWHVRAAGFKPADQFDVYHQ